MEPSLLSKTSIMLAVKFNYCMLCCVFWKWYAKVNGQLNCPITEITFITVKQIHFNEACHRLFCIAPEMQLLSVFI